MGIGVDVEGPVGKEAMLVLLCPERIVVTKIVVVVVVVVMVEMVRWKTSS